MAPEHVPFYRALTLVIRGVVVRLVTVAVMTVALLTICEADVLAAERDERDAALGADEAHVILAETPSVGAATSGLESSRPPIRRPRGRKWRPPPPARDPAASGHAIHNMLWKGSGLASRCIAAMPTAA